MESNHRRLSKEFLDSRIHAVDGATLDATAHMLLVIEDTERLMRVTARFVAERLNACRCDLGLGHHRDEVYCSDAEWLSSDSDPPSITSVELPNQHKIFQRVWQAAQPVTYDDLSNPNFDDLRDGMNSVRIKSMVARRLQTQTDTLGLICVDQTSYRREWVSEDLEFLESFSSIVLSPLLQESVRLNQQVRPSTAELKAIRMAANGLSYKQIAFELGKSIRTIEHQLRNARKKMGAAN